MSELLKAFDQFGAEKFGQVVSQMAPYFSTIDPQFLALRPGYSEAKVIKVRSVENHLGTIHAIVMCNAAELVAGTMIDASLPDGFRWIPKEMHVQYLAKAKTDIRAVSCGAGIDLNTAGDKIIPVEVFDTHGTKVFHADITMDVREH